MSSFIDKLNQVSRAVPQSMGFMRIQSASEKPKILLIASLVEDSMTGLTDYVAGADAGLLHIPESGSGTKPLTEISQAVPDIPWGEWSSNIGQQTTETGADFVVFSADDTPLAALKNDTTGKILDVKSSLSDSLLRAVNELPVDAVLITAEPEKGCYLTWHHLMQFQRCANLLTKPLLASVPPTVTADELQALWETGISGVIIEVAAGQPVDRLKELRQEIDKLTFPLQRKQGKTEALLPHIAIELDTEPEEDEEEEE